MKRELFCLGKPPVATQSVQLFTYAILCCCPLQQLLPLFIAVHGMPSLASFCNYVFGSQPAMQGQGEQQGLIRLSNLVKGGATQGRHLSLDARGVLLV